jgi:hypothetical protein
MDTIQAQVSSLPFSIQSDVNLGISRIQKLVKTQDSVDGNLLNVILAPHFARVSQASRPDPPEEPLFPAMVATPLHPDPVETAFYSRQESRPPICPPGNQDQRPRMVMQDRPLPAPDRRRDSRDPRESFTQDRTARSDHTFARSSPRPGRADSPDPDAELARLSESVRLQQGHIDKLKAQRKKVLMAQATEEAMYAGPFATPLPTQYALTTTVYPGPYPDSSNSSQAASSQAASSTSSRSSRRSAASRSS